jgi:hypothetical protein
MHGDQERYPIHIYNWLEIYGDDHEAQYPQIMSFLDNYTLKDVVIDATGKGDPIYSRMSADLDNKGVRVTPFIFSAQSKDLGYKTFLQEIQTRRFTFPAGHLATRLKKWQKFISQMYDLEKDWRGQTMVVNKPKDEKDAADDYPDSAMMLCWIVNVQGLMEIETATNPFFIRTGQRSDLGLFESSKAWLHNKVRGNRPEDRYRRSRWE